MFSQILPKIFKRSDRRARSFKMSSVLLRGTRALYLNKGRHSVNNNLAVKAFNKTGAHAATAKSIDVKNG